MGWKTLIDDRGVDCAYNFIEEMVGIYIKELGRNPTEEEIMNTIKYVIPDVIKPALKVIELNTMLKIEGITFRCECGGNVFSKLENRKYRCNSCRAMYTGE